MKTFEYFLRKMMSVKFCRFQNSNNVKQSLFTIIHFNLQKKKVLFKCLEL